MFTAEQRATLLSIARRSLEAALLGRPVPHWSCDDPALEMRCGAFVTIKSAGQLRGCIGRLTSDLPLYQLVAHLAASATQDPRFAGSRLQASELADCHIEISVLSPLERISNPRDFEIGTHGIFVRCGSQTGCFLPRVGIEAGWSSEEMLRQCCSRKAGLAPDAWRSSDVEVFRFTADVIEEPDQAGHEWRVRRLRYPDSPRPP